ncbi:hypothetical protein WA026_000730 [Henosepilachna vigintioctopunctata]|uniref:Uncharacterized protein n=1 Tax=Henosepilachna vigintioctopunctata TaxID=420089 RepID=A0AAW1V988_9CUCU
MWVQSEMHKCTQTPDQPVSLKDSPLLARVRRAMIRQEEESLRPQRSLLAQRSTIPTFEEVFLHSKETLLNRLSLRAKREVSSK